MNNMIKTGGVKKGEMMIFTASSKFIPSKFTILDQAQVDGETWYTVSCAKEVCIWMREQPEELQYWHRDLMWNKIDIHEKLYTWMALRWA
jgi:hypothetical protein